MTDSIPLAVSPGILTPGVYLAVDLLAGSASPGPGTLRIAIVADKSASGDLETEIELRGGGGEPTAKTAFGEGSPGHLAAKLLYQKYPQAVVDFAAVAPGAGVASLAVTYGGTPAANQAIDVDIHGRQYETSWLVGETQTQAAAKLVALVNQHSSDLMVAATGPTGVATLLSKVAGNVGNDVKVKVKLRAPATGTESISGASGPVSMSGGTTDPDYTNALALLAANEYHFIIPCLSNTDVNNVASQSNLAKTVNHIANYNTGLNAKLQQVVVGSTDTLAKALVATVSSNGAENVGFGEFVWCSAARSLPFEAAAREVGGRLAAESLDPAANRIGEKFDGFVGAANIAVTKPTAAQVETALGGGVAVISYNAQGAEILVRPVTTHCQTSTGGADRRLLDVQNVSAAYIIARDVRDNIALEFPNAKISKDIAEGEDPPPEGVIEERDIKAWVITRLRFWQNRGVVQKASLDEAIATGTLIVRVNPSDATQVDIVLPFKIVQPLAKFGVVAQRLAN